MEAQTTTNQPSDLTRDLDTSDKFFRYFQRAVTGTANLPLSSQTTDREEAPQFSPTNTSYLLIKDLQTQIAQLPSISASSDARGEALKHCQADLARLSDLVRACAAILPARDQRNYGEAVKGLAGRLEDARREGGGKGKFSFKGRGGRGGKMGATGATSASVLPQTAVAAGAEADESGSAGREEGRTGPRAEERGLEITDRKNAYITLPPSRSAHDAPSSAILSNLTRCVIDLTRTTYPPASTDPSSTTTTTTTTTTNNNTDTSQPHNPPPLATLTLKNLTDSLILCGRIHGPLHLTAVTRCVVVAETRQFRMHDSRDTDVYVGMESRPIIEGCVGIGFAPLPRAFLTAARRVKVAEGEDEREVEGEEERGLWSQVDDFKWLRREPSPHWRILGAGERVREGVWEGLVVGGEGVEVEVEGVLSAVGIGEGEGREGGGSTSVLSGWR